MSYFNLNYNNTSFVLKRSIFKKIYFKSKIQSRKPFNVYLKNINKCYIRRENYFKSTFLEKKSTPSKNISRYIF